MPHPKKTLEAALDRIARGSKMLVELASHPDLSALHADRIALYCNEIAAAERKLAAVLHEMPDPPAEPWSPGPQGRAILERIADQDPALELTITASGGRYAATYIRLVREGYVQQCDHPKVQSRGYPAPACRLTDKGRAFINQ